MAIKHGDEEHVGGCGLQYRVKSSAAAAAAAAAVLTSR
jgi:hypothetical protein